jgi:hypothetical protein
VNYLNPDRAISPELSILPVHEMGEAKTYSSDYKKWKDSSDARKKALQEWEDSQFEVQEVRGEVWNAAIEARNSVRKLDTILDTREKYLKMAGGDADVAQKFLENAFLPSDIENANVWKSFKDDNNGL